MKYNKIDQEKFDIDVKNDRWASIETNFKKKRIDAVQKAAYSLLDSYFKKEVLNQKDASTVAQFIVDCLDSGFSNHEIEFFFSDLTGRTFTPIKSLITPKVNQAIREETVTSIKDIIVLHYHRYEDIYREVINLRTKDGLPLKYDDLNSKEIYYVSEQFMLALEALRAKEKILGLHKRSFLTEIRKKMKSMNQKESYDLSKLDIDEQVELSEFIGKAKKKNVKVKPKYELPSIHQDDEEARKEIKKESNGFEISPIEKVQVEKRVKEKQINISSLDDIRAKIEKRVNEKIKKYENERSSQKAKKEGETKNEG